MSSAYWWLNDLSLVRSNDVVVPERYWTRQSIEFNRLSRIGCGILLLETGLSCHWHGGLKKLTNATKSRKEFLLLLVPIVGFPRKSFVNVNGQLFRVSFWGVAVVVHERQRASASRESLSTQKSLHLVQCPSDAFWRSEISVESS